MADVDRGKRPLSPHLQVYRPQITSMLSILHRITGVALTLGAVLVVAWFLAAASGPEAFETVDGLLTSWIGILVLAGSAWALAYHTLNGVRHLVWDMGYGFDLETVAKSGWAVVAGSIGLAAVIILIAAL
jgi:succinate dehydrogenase / fumarate reductase cytochrome b subunit